MFLRYVHNLSESGYWFERALRAGLSRWHENQNGAQIVVLDFGCGTRPFEKYFKDMPHRYIGLDVYPGDQVDIVYDGRDVPLADASVDIVFSVSVFEHVEDLAHSLSEMQRVLKPDGSLVAVVPFMNHVHGVPYDYHRPTAPGWEVLLTRAFGSEALVNVTPVDSRLTCLGNQSTAQINFLFFDLLRRCKGRQEVSSEKPTLEQGGASPERASAGLHLVYMLLKFNPVNFCIGLVCFLFSVFPLERRREGEITSGYLLEVYKSAADH